MASPKYIYLHRAHECGTVVLTTMASPKYIYLHRAHECGTVVLTKYFTIKILSTDLFYKRNLKLIKCKRCHFGQDRWVFN